MALRAHTRLPAAVLWLSLALVLLVRALPSAGGIGVAELIGQLVMSAAVVIGLERGTRGLEPGDDRARRIGLLLVGLAVFDLSGVLLGGSHPLGLHGMVEHGGWPSIMFAVVLGAGTGLVAWSFTLRLSMSLARSVLSRSALARPGVVSVAPRPFRSGGGLLLALHLAGRAPPAV